MKHFIFFCTTMKGYFTLEYIFRNNFLKKHIKLVVSEREINVEKDFFEDIKDLCKKNKIPFVTRKELNDSIIKDETLRFFSIGWKWMIKSVKNLIVLHDSLLPKYRGFAPVVNMLINGENKLGVTAIKANDEFDRGPIILQKEVQISYPIKIHKALEMVSVLYCDIVEKIMMDIINDIPINFVEQDETKATYSIWRDDLDYSLNFNWSANKIKRFIDATGWPYKGACCYMNNKLVRILDAYVVEDCLIEDRETHIGKVIFLKDGNPVVICGEGLICFTEIIDEASGEKIKDIKLKTRMRERK
jgi:methionyl-tRNA formyltransferase